MIMFKTFLIFLLSGLSFWAISAPVPETQQKFIQKQLEDIVSNASRVIVHESDLPNFYIIELNGQFAMVSKDGQFLIDGDVLNLKTQESLFEPLKNTQALRVIKGIKTAEIIRYPAQDEKASVWIFSDIDCGYCRKLHREMKAINQGGVTVNYLAFPRGGVDTVSWDKSKKVWCAGNKQQAMDLAKSGDSLNKLDADCDVDIEAQYNAGIAVGVKGTPTIVLSDGSIIPGYLPAEKLIKAAQQVRLEK